MEKHSNYYQLNVWVICSYLLRDYYVKKKPPCDEVASIHVVNILFISVNYPAIA
ncbi:hypothetical protein KKG31_02940 [Patescibacteria group bacterium]|nr:hypothetical protein [Patescibacteria group bacterium]